MNYKKLSVEQLNELFYVYYESEITGIWIDFKNRVIIERHYSDTHDHVYTQFITNYKHQDDLLKYLKHSIGWDEEAHESIAEILTQVKEPTNE